MHLLFVCSGNTCRSPLAESIARQLVLDRNLRDIEVKSAGTSANANAPASDGALLVALEQGLDLSTHRSQELSPELVQWADVILTMGSHHLDVARSLGGNGRSYLLSDFASRGDEPSDMQISAIRNGLGVSFASFMRTSKSRPEQGKRAGGESCGLVTASLGNFD